MKIYKAALLKDLLPPTADVMDFIQQFMEEGDDNYMTKEDVADMLQMLKDNDEADDPAIVQQIQELSKVAKFVVDNRIDIVIP